MEINEEIEKILLKFPICEYAFGKVEQIPFSERVPAICQSDCERYGRCWTCPPYCGTFEELKGKCLRYHRFCMFSTVTETADVWDEKEDLKVKGQHEKITADIRSEMSRILPDLLMLSTGCTKCKSCTCPESPCRFPKERVYSIESHGIVVMQLAKSLGISHFYEGNTVVYFSMFLY